MHYLNIGLLVVVFAGLFWLAPHQIMLATCNRLSRKRFHDFTEDIGFVFLARRRIFMAGAGLAVSITSYLAVEPQWMVPIVTFIALMALYIEDFRRIERVATHL
ncbi:hypothetical protein ACOYW6_01320 [Parablastomonas sp. CN1-191]|uniref:hypothetical protein n=1 Tax=Parablastomonas sp. CN1-191 TaxID=3400908 RepID=UPI003BF7D196